MKHNTYSWKKVVVFTWISAVAIGMCVFIACIQMDEKWIKQKTIGETAIINITRVAGVRRAGGHGQSSRPVVYHSHYMRSAHAISI